MTSAYARTDSGEGEGSPKATRPGVENAIFPWREIARCFWATVVAFEKEVSLKSLSLFSKTIVRRYCSFKLEKKTFNTYKWKEKVQKNTGSRRKLQVTKAAFKGHHRFVFFTAESLPCSETQPSK